MDATTYIDTSLRVLLLSEWCLCVINSSNIAFIVDHVIIFSPSMFKFLLINMGRFELFVSLVSLSYQKTFWINHVGSLGLHEHLGSWYLVQTRFLCLKYFHQLLYTLTIHCHQKEKGNTFYVTKPLVLDKQTHCVLLKYY